MLSGVDYFVFGGAHDGVGFLAWLDKGRDVMVRLTALGDVSADVTAGTTANVSASGSISAIITAIEDEASLRAFAAYVDLNPIRAAMCETLESSDHTSVQRRIAAIAKSKDLELAATPNDSVDLGNAELPEPIRRASRSIGSCASQSDRGCSDKGFVPMSLEDYLELLD